ncbi:2'-5' RNA ligase family protein [Nakamurella sp. A5-74]|uniref:2'-5' RNA ligase family protein n=1 Tax=Nakamurella sp. A5-74 TaxID=3158264 RepID=A0AAU8DPY8_9ACTN
MTVGVVAWPDIELSRAVTAIWRAVADAGCPSLVGTVQIPHLSFVVADSFNGDAVARACGAVPREPIQIDAVTIGVFPGGIVHLGIRPTTALLEEHRRVQAAAAPYLVEPWPYFAPDEWTPHITIAMGLDSDQVSRAVSATLTSLPLSGHLVRGGIEDGDTGHRILLQ